MTKFTRPIILGTGHANDGATPMRQSPLEGLRGRARVRAADCAQVPYFGVLNKDPTIQGTILGSPIFGNSHINPLTNLQGSSYFRCSWFSSGFNLFGVGRLVCSTHEVRFPLKLW